MNTEIPSVGRDFYTCPHCGTLTDQTPLHLYQNISDDDEEFMFFSLVRIRTCRRCSQDCVWYRQKLLYPFEGAIPSPPHPDLPEDARQDVEEARGIINLSPRSAAALLRLALEKLCNHLGAEGRSLDSKVGWLVENRRLDPMVQQALDVVRVVGNEAVHPGTLDLRDNVQDVTVLFGMINEIVEDLITRPKRIRERYEMLPEAKRKAAEKRDQSRKSSKQK